MTLESTAADKTPGAANDALILKGLKRDVDKAAAAIGPRTRAIIPASMSTAVVPITTPFAH
jgi:hypothetical protein